MRVEGVEKVKAALNKAAKKYGEETRPSVVVGYQAAYALFIHENIEMKWKGLPRDRSVRKHKTEQNVVTTGHRETEGKGVFWGPNGQAKYLEQPARELASTLGKIVRQAVKAGNTLLEGLLMAGRYLQKESQKLVPVDTTNLKQSAFTEVEGGGKSGSSTMIGEVEV